jgi:sterol desaturase/sphingolipid hydroxylase (fatty acid hydroxylase superfamily)
MEENVKQYYAFINGQIKMPEHLAPQKTEKGVLFKNPFVEKYLSRTPVWVVQVMWIAVAAFVIWHSYARVGLAVWHIILLFSGGVLFWTFAEYMVHRFLYHSETNSKFLYRLQYNAHGIHHQYPRDPDRLAMPPLPALIIASVFLALFWLALRDSSFPFFSGFMIGYILYISFHYAEHRFHPIRIFKKLWEHHAYHHYKNPYKDFGVSTQLWDWVFGSMSKPEKKN